MDGYLGEIRLFAGTFVPEYWASCDGSLVSVSANMALYSIVSTTFGGDGVNNFALPNLNGKVAVGPGTGFTHGQSGGNQNVTLSTANLPVHTHSIPAHSHALNGSSSAATGTSPSGALPAVTDENAYGTTNLAAMHSSAVGDSSVGTSGSTGSASSFSVMQPYQVVRYIICVSGYYPSRP
ncbi:MAG TPA: tail fiber protein [bacterium]|nr:tail fiber protein [bacterium]